MPAPVRAGSPPLAAANAFQAWLTDTMTPRRSSRATSTGGSPRGADPIGPWCRTRWATEGVEAVRRSPSDMHHLPVGGRPSDLRAGIEPERTASGEAPQPVAFPGVPWSDRRPGRDTRVLRLSGVPPSGVRAR